MQSFTKIYIRADGNSQIGLGHVIRSLALAEILKEYFHIHFIIRTKDVVLITQIEAICNQITCLPDELSFKEEAEYLCSTIIEDNSIVVLDGYHFDSEYQRILRSDALKLICIDDIFSNHFLADVVINHGGGITKEMYKAEPYTRFFLGPEYALLRKPFREPFQIDFNNRENALFICLGGADPNNDVLKIVENCATIDIKQQLYIVLGSAYQNLDILLDKLKTTNLKYKILQNLSALEMAQYMKKCAIAITAPSTVSYEYLSIGGVLYLYQTADNQKHIYKYLIKEGLALDWSQFPEEDHSVLGNLLEKQKQIFDGQARQRLYKIFRNLDHDLNAKLRSVGEKDLMTLFEWANDPSTRAQSFNKTPIPLEDHCNWFFKQLKDTNCFFYILEYQNEPIGMVRFNIKADKAVISYSIANNFRGKGFGKVILEKGIEQLRKVNKSNVPIVGYVKKRNFASIKTFENLHFEKQETEDYEDSFLFRLEENL